MAENFEGQVTPEWEANDLFAAGPEGKSRGVAALLALFLGAYGAHLFYTGKMKAGILYACVTVLSCFLLCWVTGIASLVQAVRLFMMTNEEFREKYILSEDFLPF